MPAKKGCTPWNKGKIERFEKKCLSCSLTFLVVFSRKDKDKFCSISCGLKGNKHLLGKHWKLKSSRVGNIGTTGKHWQNPKETIIKRSGENHYRWIKDRTLVVGRHTRNWHDPEYKQWHKSVLKRDRYRCRISDLECAGRLETHHILIWSKYPELRYQITNGITLCHAHHPRRRAEEKRLVPVFQELVSVSSE